MSLLRLDVDNKVNIQSEALIGVSAAILGITGSGKSNTAAVLIEESLTNGLPMTIVDIEGEHWGLKERFEILVAGRGEHVDVEVGLEKAEQLVELSVRQRLSVILDLGEFSLDEQFDFLVAYLTRLWEVCSSLKQPYQVVVEEAHEFVPQGGRTPVKEILIRIFKRGRKRGLSCVLVSQRSQKVDKEVLTQARLFFLHRVIHPVDLRVCQDLIPLPARQVDQMITSLSSGQAAVLFENKLTVAQIRLRSTFHAGATPSLGETPLPTLREIDKAILNVLRAPAAAPRETEASPAKEHPQAAGEIAELRRQIELLKAENQRLCEQIKNSIVKPVVGSQVDIVPKTQPEDDSEPGTPDGKPYRSTKRQQKLFDFLLTDIFGLSIRHRKMLRFLVEREGRVFSMRDIARALDYSESSLETRYLDLLQLGLIQRTGSGKGRRYTSKATEYFRTEFPDLDPEALRETLLSKLMHKEVNHR